MDEAVGRAGAGNVAHLALAPLLYPLELVGATLTADAPDTAYRLVVADLVRLD